jgi:Holliday junction resolvase
MTEKKYPFYAYRYLVTPTSEQISIIQKMSKSKEELMNNIISDLALNTKTIWVKGGKRYLFYGFQNRDNIFIVKFARETKENIYVEGDEDIEIKGIKEAKFIYLIIDTEHQIILIEKNSSVFPQIENSVNILAEYFRNKMRQFDYVVNIYPLVSKRKFWSYVESAEKIYELTLVMNAPNMSLFGNSDTREVLREIKNATNNEVLDISLKNKEGSLKILKEVIGNYIEYVREVGGKYLLKFKRNGTRETKTSETDTAVTYLEKKNKEKYSEEELSNISEKLTSIHTLESRDDNEDEEQ